jgi:hypothetical protein
MSMLLTFLIYIIIIALVYWVVTYALNNLPLPAPIKQFGTVIVTIVIVVVVVFMLIQLLQGGLGGMGHLSFK